MEYLIQVSSGVGGPSSLLEASIKRAFSHIPVHSGNERKESAAVQELHAIPRHFACYSRLISMTIRSTSFHGDR